MSGHDVSKAEPAKPGIPSAEAILSQMERILADPSFEANARRREMFRYIVQESVAGRGELLKGFTVALAVFGRDESFDAQSDPIVRIEARRLRSDLDGYYAGKGHNDPLRIVIPKGGYEPRAYWQDQADAPPPAAGTAEGTAGPELAAPAPQSTDPAPASRRPLVLVALALAALLVLVGGIALVTLQRQTSEPTPAAQITAVPLLVLPFAAPVTSEDSRFLAQGMTQQLIADLMRFSGLKLYTESVSFRQDPGADAPALGKALNVAYVVRGSVAEEAGRLQVIADLEDAATGQVVWSKSYDLAQAAQAVLTTRADVVAEIATQLGQSYGVIKTDLLDRAARTSDVDMSSYLCVLQAQAYRRTFDTSVYDKVMACLTEASQTDPDYADVWAMLGWLKLDAARFEMVPAADRPRLMRAAAEAAQRAVDLDARSVSGLQALAAITYYSGQYSQSEQLMRQALALNPNDPETLVQFGWRLSARGNWDEGMPLVDRGIARTMSPPGWYFHSVAVQAYLAEDYAKAIEAAERSARNGSSVGLVIVAAAQGQLGDRAKAQEALATLAELDPDSAKDPAALFKAQQVIDPTITALMDGLKKAGWAPS